MNSDFEVPIDDTFLTCLGTTSQMLEGSDDLRVMILGDAVTSLIVCKTLVMCTGIYKLTGINLEKIAKVDFHRKQLEEFHTASVPLHKSNTDIVEAAEYHCQLHQAALCEVVIEEGFKDTAALTVLGLMFWSTIGRKFLGTIK